MKVGIRLVSLDFMSTDDSFEREVGKKYVYIRACEEILRYRQRGSWKDVLLSEGFWVWGAT